MQARSVSMTCPVWRRGIDGDRSSDVHVQDATDRPHSFAVPERGSATTRAARRLRVPLGSATSAAGYGPYQTLPCMSNRPHALCWKLPTAAAPWSGRRRCERRPRPGAAGVLPSGQSDQSDLSGDQGETTEADKPWVHGAGLRAHVIAWPSLSSSTTGPRPMASRSARMREPSPTTTSATAWGSIRSRPTRFACSTVTASMSGMY